MSGTQKIIALQYKLLPHVCALARSGSWQRLLSPIPGVEQYNIAIAGFVTSDLFHEPRRGDGVPYVKRNGVI